MTATTKVHIKSAADGSFSHVVHAAGEILAISLVIGTLSTPDVAITDTLTGAAIFTKTGIAATNRWQPKVKVQTTAGVDIVAAAGPPVLQDVYASPVCTKSLSIVVAGAGDTLEGDLYISFA